MSSAGVDRRWEDLRLFVPGQHGHLDQLMERPPAPGSHDWLPVIEEVATFLTHLPGSWVVTFSIGQCDEAPRTETTREQALMLVARPEEFEPPAVYLLDKSPAGNGYAGEYRSWERIREDGIKEVVSFSRSPEAKQYSEGWTASIALRVN